MNGTAKKGTVALILFVVAFVWAAQAQELAPSIVLPKTRHEFGKIFESDVYEYSFVVQNRGKADLVIDKVEPG